MKPIFFLLTNTAKTLEKKSLYKLLDLVAPYNEHYKTLILLCAKYGIDSLSIEEKIGNNKKTGIKY
jgi:hypothetical protein